MSVSFALRSIRPATLGRAVAASVSASLILAALGCSGLGSVDRRIENMLERRTDRIGGAVSPTREFRPVEEQRVRGQTDKEPPTNNPRAEDLFYGIAAEDRDVAMRIDEFTALPEDAMRIDLVDALRIAQESGREFRNAEEEYILSAIRLLIERHRWGPRFFNDLSANVSGDFDGDADTALRIMNDLRVTQRLPYGGQVEAGLIVEAVEQLRDSATESYRQSTALVLNANIPLLRGAGDVAREDLIQTERDLVYAARTFERFRREFLVSIATDYFNLVAQLASIDNQERSLQSVQLALERSQARVRAGQEAASQARTIEQQVLETQSRLISARESYILALDRFKIRLGLPVETPVIMTPSKINLPEPDTTPGEASQLALLYRLDLQNQRDRIDDSRRNVAIAHNQILPDLNFNANVRADTDPNDRIGGLDLQFDDARYNVGVTFGLPLDREIERLNLRSAMIGLARIRRTYDQFRDNVIVDARQQRRRIDQDRFRLELAERGVETSRLAIEQIIIQQSDAITLLDAEDRLLNSENDRDNALRDLRISILSYLLATDLLRVDRDGNIQPLPGMPQRLIESDAEGLAAPGTPGEGESEEGAVAPELEPTPPTPEVQPDEEPADPDNGS